jgi:hypothetical protein
MWANSENFITYFALMFIALMRFFPIINVFDITDVALFIFEAQIVFFMFIKTLIVIKRTRAHFTINKFLNLSTFNVTVAQETSVFADMGLVIMTHITWHTII